MSLDKQGVVVKVGKVVMSSYLQLTVTVYVNNWDTYIMCT